MEKKSSKKKGLLIGGIILLVIILAVVAFILYKNGYGYRLIQVYQFDGDTQVVRASETMTPYENMRLLNGDQGETFADSHLYLRMDTNKYLLAEPETRFQLEATGTRNNSRTLLTLEVGALVSHLTTPLNSSSTYEVETPNSIMAVRGTSFRVYVWYDADGVSHTLVQVFEGRVTTRLLYPDGTVSEETREFTSGETVTIWGNTHTSDYDAVEDEIDYYSLQLDTLEFLRIGIAKLGTYDIDAFALDEIIRMKQTSYSVTFTVDGRVFGTQSVLFDNYAHAPMLRPTANGYWDFDFSTPIRADTEVRWIAT